MKKIILTAFLFFVATIFVVGFFLKRERQLQLAEQQKQSQKAVQVSITIPEGWTVEDIAQDLDNNPKRTDEPHVVNSADFIAAEQAFSVDNYPLLKSKPVTADLEGFLFPDTYFIPTKVPSTTTISDVIIKKMLDNFSLKFTPVMVAQAQTGNISIFDAVTLASIIEKEVPNDADRKVVAGIFYNRLNMGMALQSDATVTYITHKNNPQSTGEDLSIDSPYNTYKYKGLPPGPISNPSLSSLMAALYPTKTDYLYFLTDPATGRAVFAKTYDEQLANEKKYLK